MDPKGGGGGEFIEFLEIFEENSEFDGQFIVGVYSPVDLQLIRILNLDGETVGLMAETHLLVVGGGHSNGGLAHWQKYYESKGGRSFIAVSCIQIYCNTKSPIFN